MSDETDEIYERFHRAMMARAPQIANSDNDKISAADKMEIYKAIARLKLLSCIRTSYPKTFDAMDKNEFERLALSFIQQNPHQTHDLKAYPNKFADFVCTQIEDQYLCTMVRSEQQHAQPVDC